MARKTLVTGATGTLGKAVLARLVDTATGDDEIVVGSRRPRPPEQAPYSWATLDYTTGAGCDTALEGVDTIIHCLSSRRDTVADRTIIDAARRAGTAHLVHISIVGIDRVNIAFYRRKLETERLIEDSGVPYSILRTTQFHDLVATVCRALTKPPIAFAPAFALQPVEVREVAARLVDLANGSPAGRVPDMGGPQVRRVRDLMHAYLQANQKRRRIVPFALPGRLFGHLKRGAQLAPEHADGTVTFEEYLANADKT